VPDPTPIPIVSAILGRQRRPGKGHMDRSWTASPRAALRHDEHIICAGENTSLQARARVRPATPPGRGLRGAPRRSQTLFEASLRAHPLS
jgi:hypothetical protein